MIDLLVERYGVDPNGAADEDGWTALHWAAWYGRVRTVKHLVEKHKVDIHKRSYKMTDGILLWTRQRRMQQ
jgi:ankyrin repeat protein